MSYQIDGRSLAEIRREIKSKIIEQIELERQPGGRLEDVQSVVYGSRADIGDVHNMPTLWIIPEPHQPELKGGHTAIHDFNFGFVAMIYNINDPEIGQDEAEDTNARIYDVINGLRRSNNFFDVRPLNIDPAFEGGADVNVFFATCEFAFRIQRRE